MRENTKYLVNRTLAVYPWCEVPLFSAERQKFRWPCLLFPRQLHSCSQLGLDGSMPFSYFWLYWSIWLNIEAAGWLISSVFPCIVICYHWPTNHTSRQTFCSRRVETGVRACWEQGRSQCSHWLGSDAEEKWCSFIKDTGVGLPKLKKKRDMYVHTLMMGL